MYPNAYIQYLVHFHCDRDYFECHEVLEDYWKEADCVNKESVWVGLILLAVSAYHHRRGNFIGAARTLEKAITNLKNNSKECRKLGLDPSAMETVLRERLAEIQSGSVYSSFNLPIEDKALLIECKQTCSSMGFSWGRNSDFSNPLIIHRHLHRDRSDVIKERDDALQLRTKKGRE